jgi:hypothetical protein
MQKRGGKAYSLFINATGWALIQRLTKRRDRRRRQKALERNVREAMSKQFASEQAARRSAAKAPGVDTYPESEPTPD